MKKFLSGLMLVACLLCGTAIAHEELLVSTGSYFVMNSDAAGKFVMFHCPDLETEAFECIDSQDYETSGNFTDMLPWDSGQGAAEFVESMQYGADIYLYTWDSYWGFLGNDVVFAGTDLPDLSNKQITRIEIEYHRVVDYPGPTDLYSASLAVYGEDLD